VRHARRIRCGDIDDDDHDAKMATAGDDLAMGLQQVCVCVSV
jgi:hypothetical protein